MRCGVWFATEDAGQEEVNVDECLDTLDRVAWADMCRHRLDR